MKNKLKFLPTFIFLGFIFVLFALFIIMPKSQYSSSEKRYLEKFPEVSLKSVSSGEFESGFETYLADHFPFRNLWVGVNAYYNYGIGNNGNDGIYKCSDNYLINAPVSEDNRIEVNARAIARFSRNVNVPVTVAVVPSTGYIMDDVLPAVHDEYIDDELFGKITFELYKESSGLLSFTDLRTPFKEQTAKGAQLYYRTDHHWTSEGAYTAYRELCKSLGLTSTPKSQFNVKAYGGFYGTTYSSSGFWLNPADDIEVWSNKSNSERNITVTVTEGDEEKTYHSMFFLNHLEQDDKYPLFLDGNHPLVSVENKRVREGKILIVKDSFCHSLAPFLADNFNTVTMVDMRYYKNSVSDMVKQGNYDRVLFVYGIDNLAADSDLVWIK